MIKIAYLGNGIAGASTLNYLINCKNFNIVKVYSSLQNKAKRLQRDILTVTKKINQDLKFVDNWNNVLSDLVRNHIDVVVVCSFGRIIPEFLLEKIKGGWWNIHFSLLPKYRGATPIQSAILNGDKITGTTIFKIDKGIDTGKILCQKKIAISPNDNFLSLVEKLSKISSSLLCRYLPKYLDGKVKLKKQKGKPSYCYRDLINREKGRIDWSKNVISIDRIIRAFIPDPCGWTEIVVKKKKYEVKILKGYVLMRDAKKRMPDNLKTDGQITKSKNGIIVRCGRGLYFIQEVLVSGKGRMDSISFWNGYLKNIENPRFL